MKNALSLNVKGIFFYAFLPLTEVNGNEIQIANYPIV